MSGSGAAWELTGFRHPLWMAAALPIILLGALLGALAWFGPLGVLNRGAPPVEQLSIERIEIRADPPRFVMTVVNAGTEPVIVAQVLVDDAYWEHSVVPERRLPYLGRATVTIPYPWVEGERHEVKLLTSTGTVMAGEIPVAVESPQFDGRWFAALTMVGMYVGVIPVAIGLLWYPFLRTLDRRWVHVALAFTAGLLVFLAADALAESVEMAVALPPAYHGIGLILAAVVITLVVLQLVAGNGQRAAGDDAAGRRALAAFVALSIGLHNLGEGMAVGAAYGIGEVALGASLVAGFAIHNVTEGLGIAGPVAHDRVGFPFLAGVGLLAGVPTIVGAWIGGLAYAPVIAILFLSVGAGAALQVVYQIAAIVRRRSIRELAQPSTIIGFAAGVAAMYATALFVGA
ncbi:MAG: metal transporter [Chloroflexi bacterium]|nr:metal transporter [Chloroflexota bacterium]